MKCDALKAYKGDVTIPVYGTIADAQVYLKKDVDEAIAELKEFAEDACIERDDNQTAIDELQYENASLKSEADKVITHHKYKRCLAMARLCHKESLWWYSKGYGFEKYDKFWEKWEKRWLELAKKFKEVK